MKIIHKKLLMVIGLFIFFIVYTSWKTYNYLGIAYHSGCTYYGYYNEISLICHIVSACFGFIICYIIREMFK